MAGHCQLNIGNGQIFIFGGITTIGYNNYDDFTKLEHDDEAWLWKDNHWLPVTSQSPCPKSRQPITILQQCAIKGANKVVIISQNFDDFTTCTSVLNIRNFEWTQISLTKDLILPIGGLILTGIDSNDLYYLGGYTNMSDSSNRTVFELTNKWVPANMKLPFAMTLWDSLLLDNQLNLTECMADVQHWPQDFTF